MRLPLYTLFPWVIALDISGSAVGEFRVKGAQSEGEGDGDDRDGDDEYGDRDDPRLLLDGREGDAERDGQETEDESTGEHGVPQSDGDVITCSEDESDGEDRVDYEGGGPHVPSADTLDDHRYRKTDRRGYFDSGIAQLLLPDDSRGVSGEVYRGRYRGIL